MLDVLPEPLAALPDEIERANWASRSIIYSKATVQAATEPGPEMQALPGGATEMVPSLAERGGWALELRGSEGANLRMHGIFEGRGSLVSGFAQSASLAVLQTLPNMPMVGIASYAVAQALADLAVNRSVHEVAHRLSLDPSIISEVLRTLSSQLRGQVASATAAADDARSTNQDWDVFQHLIVTWKKERGATSSIPQMSMCPSYQKIIGMGEKAVPLILRQLQSESDDPGHWHWALSAITGANPVPEDAIGNTRKISKAWLQWARDKYAW